MKLLFTTNTSTVNIKEYIILNMSRLNCAYSFSINDNSILLISSIEQFLRIK